MKEVAGTEKVWPADLVLLAMGFLGPEKEGLLADLGVKLDERTNVAVDADKLTSVPGVFAAGDMARGQSLIVWAIQEGRAAARGVDQFLMGETLLHFWCPCGIALDVAARIAAHDAGTGARYTRGRGPLEVVAVRRCREKGTALRIEHAVKRLSRPEKLALAGAPVRFASIARAVLRRRSPPAVRPG